MIVYSRRLFALTALAVLSIQCLACSDESPGTHDSPNEPAQQAPVGAWAPQASRTNGETTPLDLDAVIRRARSTFRRNGDGFVLARPDYRLSVGRGGLEVSPQRVGIGSGAPIHLQTRQIRRRGWDAVGVTGIRRESGTKLALGRGAVTEHLQSTSRGLEQSWHFEKRPAGDGDLVVEVSAQGQRMFEVTDTGLHFEDPDTGLGVRYGHGTWIDAAGERTAVPATWSDGHIELRVPARIVASSGFPAVLDPIISPEFGTDAPISSPAQNTQYNPSLAFDGTNYLVAWSDRRGPAYAARVSEAGVLLDEFAIPLPVITASAEVAFDGTNFVVVGTTDPRGDPVEVHAVRIASTGTVLDPQGIPIATQHLDHVEPNVASNGNNSLITWRAVRQTGPNTAAHEIHAKRLAPWGALLDAQEITVSSAGAAPAVASDGTDYLVAWHHPPYGQGSRDIAAARVSSAGIVLDVLPRDITHNIADHQQNPAVAFAGGNYVVVWDDERFSGADYIYGARVATNGTVLDPDGLPIEFSGDSLGNVEAAFDGTNLLVVWQDGPEFTGKLIDPSLTQDPIAVFSFAHASGFDVATNGAHFFAVWEGVFGQRVSATQGKIDTTPLVISKGANRQRPEACVAFDGTNYLLAWVDQRNEASTGLDIYATRVAPDGTVLDDPAVPIAQGPYLEGEPSCGFDGTNYLVAWTHSNGSSPYEVRGARVTPAGAVLDSGGFAIASGSVHQWSPQVAFDGTNYLVVFSRQLSSTERHLYANQVAPSGTVLHAAPFAVARVAQMHEDVDVAWGGTNFLVVWEQDADIYATRVLPNGMVVDPQGRALAAQSHDEFDPSVASDGTNFLVTWYDFYSFAADSRDVHGVRVSPQAAILDTPALDIGASPSSQHGAQVTATPQGFFVSWNNWESTALGRDIWGSRVLSDGTVLDPIGLPLVEKPGEQELVTAGADGNGNVMIIGHEFDDSVGSDRLFGHLIHPDGVPGVSNLSVTTPEDTAVAITLPATDPNGDTLTYNITSGPAHGTLSGSGANRTYTPATDYHGTDTFTFVALDGSHHSREATVTVEMTWVNDTPTIAPPVRLTALEDEFYDVTLTITDPDTDSVYVTAPLIPDWLSAYKWDYREAALKGRPLQDDIGLHTVELRVEDENGASSTQSFDIEVIGVNDVPVATPMSASTQEDTPVVVTLEGEDVDADTLDFSITQQPQHGTLSGAGPSFTYTPDAEFFGQDTFAFTVNDGTVDSDPAAVDIEVTPVDDPPTWVAPTPADQQSFSLTEGDTLEFTLAAEDPESSTITYLMSGSPDQAMLDRSTGEFRWTVGWRDAGETELALIATDGTSRISRQVSVLVGFIDKDSDEVPDTWEQAHGLSGNSNDSDGDSISDADEVAGSLENPRDRDSDGTVDAADEDSDGDSVPDAIEAGDNELSTPPIDSDGDGVPDYLSNDSDADGSQDGDDNCRLEANADQGDLDGDGSGDACDEDDDGDGIVNVDDACARQSGTAANGCPEVVIETPSGDQGGCTTTPASSRAVGAWAVGAWLILLCFLGIRWRSRRST